MDAVEQTKEIESASLTLLTLNFKLASPQTPKWAQITPWGIPTQM